MPFTILPNGYKSLSVRITNVILKVVDSFRTVTDFVCGSCAFPFLARSHGLARGLTDR